jgi:hypothetical protein
MTAQRACAHTSSAEEARWNYAFWRQRPLLDVFTDPEGSALMDTWFAQCDEETDEREVFRALGELAVSAAKQLHADGTIQRVFHRPIPIIFHDLEGGDEMFEWTRVANPDGLADEFLSCNGGFR